MKWQSTVRSKPSRLIEVMFLQLLADQTSSHNLAVIALDKEAGLLLTRFRQDWSCLDEVHLDALVEITRDLADHCLELDAETTILYLRTTLPPTFRLTDPKSLLTDDVDAEIVKLEAAMIKGVSQRTPSERYRHFELLALGCCVRLLRTALAGCRQLRVDGFTVKAFAGGLLATLLLVVAGSAVFRPNALPRTVAQQQSSRAHDGIVSDASFYNKADLPVKQPDLNIKAQAVRRSVARTSTDSHKQRLLRSFTLPHSRPFSADVVMSSPDEQLSPVAPYQSSSARFEWPDLPPPPQRSTTTAARVFRTLGRPFKVVGRLLSDASRQRDVDTTPGSFTRRVSSPNGRD